jgi:hypothetical protein
MRGYSKMAARGEFNYIPFFKFKLLINIDYTLQVFM